MLVVLTIISLAMMESSNRRHQQDRDTWQRERKDLIDRIQAPTFAEYTNKVVREKKAEQPEEKQEPVEFVS